MCFGGLSNEFVVVVVLFSHFLWSSIANHLNPNVDSTESAEKQHRPFIYSNTNETKLDGSSSIVIIEARKIEANRSKRMGGYLLTLAHYYFCKQGKIVIIHTHHSTCFWLANSHQSY